MTEPPNQFGDGAAYGGDRSRRSAPRPRTQSNRDAMQAYWERAGMKDVSTEVVRITVAYDNFDDFWKSCNVPIGPSGNAVANLTAAKREDLREHLREKLKPASDGRIIYEAFAVKGTAPP